MPEVILIYNTINASRAKTCLDSITRCLPEVKLICGEICHPYYFDLSNINQSTHFGFFKKKYLDQVYEIKTALEIIKPDLVLSFEEFSPLQAARLADIKSLFITSWLPSLNFTQKTLISYADLILICNEIGKFHLQEKLTVTATYVGSIEPYIQDIHSKVLLRKQFNISNDDICISVINDCNIQKGLLDNYDLIIPAFQKFKDVGYKLLWPAKKESETLKRFSKIYPSLIIIRNFFDYQEIIKVSDLVITNGAYGVHAVCNALSIPAVAVMDSLLDMESIYISNFSTTITYQHNALTELALYRTIKQIIKNSTFRSRPWQNANVAVSFVSKIREQLNI